MNNILKPCENSSTYWNHVKQLKYWLFITSPCPRPCSQASTRAHFWIFSGVSGVSGFSGSRSGVTRSSVGVWDHGSTVIDDNSDSLLSGWILRCLLRCLATPRANRPRAVGMIGSGSLAGCSPATKKAAEMGHPAGRLSLQGGSFQILCFIIITLGRWVHPLNTLSSCRAVIPCLNTLS